jgi:formate-dependent nitrite reductase membrane component NrfD
MELFSETANRVMDVIGISALFLQVMLFEFELKDERHRRWKNINLFVFIGYTTLTIMSRTGLGVKIFAAVMLVSALIVEVILSRKRKLEGFGTIHE